MDKPKVSVIIPLYNGKKFLGETIDSVLAQTYKNLEILVINDGSTDHPEEILESYSQIRVINQENSGCPAGAKNRGIRESKGDYLAFLDQDDLWNKDKIEKQMAVFEGDSQIGLVLSNCRAFDSESREVTEPLWKKIGEYDQDYLKNRFLKENFVMTSSQAMVKKSVFQNEFFDEKMKLADDYELWYRLAKTSKVILMQDSLTLWRHSAKSLSNDNEKMIADLIYFYDKIERSDPENHEAQIEKEKYLVRLGNLFVQKRKFDRAIEIYNQAIDSGAENSSLRIIFYLVQRFPLLAFCLLSIKNAKRPKFAPILGLTIGNEYE